MDSHVLGVLIPIIVPIAMFALIFGIYYLRNRERMAMIERGMDPRMGEKPLNRNYSLTWGMLLIGSGLGLFLAFLLDNILRFQNPQQNFENEALYFSLIGFFGGVGLLVAYMVERKEAKNKDKTVQ